MTTQPAIQQLTANQRDSGIIAVAARGFPIPKLPVMNKGKPARQAFALRATDRPAATGDAESSFDLLAKARAGDRQALDDLLTRYRPRLQRWAHARGPAAGARSCSGSRW